MIDARAIPTISLSVLRALLVALLLAAAVSTTAIAYPSPPQNVLECEQICLQGITWE